MTTNGVQTVYLLN